MKQVADQIFKNHGLPVVKFCYLFLFIIYAAQILILCYQVIFFDSKPMIIILRSQCFLFLLANSNNKINNLQKIILEFSRKSIV